MTHRYWAGFSAILVATVSSLAEAAISAGRQDYIVMGRESQYVSLAREYQTALGGTISDDVISVVSFTATTDNEIVIVDHWEDGFEPNPFGAITQPLTTMRFV